MLLTSSDTKRTLMHLLLFTNSDQRELVSIYTHSIHNRNWLSLHYILGQDYNRWQRRICTLSVQLYSYASVNSVFVSNKIINNNDNFRIKCLSYSEISALYFLFLHFFVESWKTCQLLWENLVFFVIFDTFDVMYHWSISLLPPIVLDNLFDQTWKRYPYLRS